MEIKGLSWFCAKKKGSHFKLPFADKFYECFSSSVGGRTYCFNRKSHTACFLKFSRPSFNVKPWFSSLGFLITFDKYIVFPTAYGTDISDSLFSRHRKCVIPTAGARIFHIFPSSIFCRVRRKSSSCSFVRL